MVDAKKKKSRWRWVRRVGLGVVVLVLILGAIPFLFTTALTRWALGRSGYARFRPTIGGASLSLRGGLVVENLALYEAAGGEKKIVSAGRVAVTFSWWGVMHSEVGQIRVDDAVVFLRRVAKEGEKRKEGDLGFTVLDLMGSDGGSGGGGGGIAAAVKPFWFDGLRVEGDLLAEDLTEFENAATDLPFYFSSRMHGDAMRPGRDFTIGAEDLGPQKIRIQFSTEPEGQGTRMVLQELKVKQLNGTIATAAAEAMLVNFPKGMREAFDVSVGELEAAGSMEVGGKGGVFDGTVSVKGVSVGSAADAKSKWGVTNLNLQGKVHGPSGAGFLAEGMVTEGEVSFDSLLYGKNEVKGFSTPIGMGEGKLDATKIVAGFAGGDFSGEVSYLVAEKKLGKASLHVAHLDQAQVAANLAPDKVNAEGTVSGTVELSSGERSPVVGTIDLTADGAGRLQIKDEQTAEALAQKLGTGAAAGVLPANFSDIVVGQLKDYPYATGHILVTAPDGVPVVTLNYHREGVKAGEPGFGVKTTVAGQAVTANYTVQLPELTVVLKGKTITELLSLATGLEQDVVGAGDEK